MSCGKVLIQNPVLSVGKITLEMVFHIHVYILSYPPPKNHVGALLDMKSPSHTSTEKNYKCFQSTFTYGNFLSLDMSYIGNNEFWSQKTNLEHYIPGL